MAVQPLTTPTILPDARSPQFRHVHARAGYELHYAASQLAPGTARTVAIKRFIKPAIEPTSTAPCKLRLAANVCMPMVLGASLSVCGCEDQKSLSPDSRAYPCLFLGVLGVLLNKFYKASAPRTVPSRAAQAPALIITGTR